MSSDNVESAVIEWLRAHPSDDGYELREIARKFGISPERLRDRLRRLVDDGKLTQSDPVHGFSDGNPSYRLIADTSE
jgi:DNA-binding GntR family transcriptional regulator